MRASAMRSRLPPRLTSGLPNATRSLARTHASSSASSARPISRMQWWMRPGPRRAWAIANAWPGPPMMALAGRRTSLKDDFAVAAGRVVKAHRREHPLDRHARRVQRDEHHRVLVVAVGVRVGEAHEDEHLAVGVTDAGAPPLAAVEHHLVAVERAVACMLVASEEATSGSVMQKAERISRPAAARASAALRVGAEVQQHLHVAGVGGVAVADLGGDQRAAHALGQGGVLDVREAGADGLAAARRPGAGTGSTTPRLASHRLELLDHGRDRRPRVSACQ